MRTGFFMFPACCKNLNVMFSEKYCILYEIIHCCHVSLLLAVINAIYRPLPN
jgi:hypothetical protein